MGRDRDSKRDCRIIEDHDNLVYVSILRRLPTLWLLVLFAAACSSGGQASLPPGAPTDGWTVFTSESMRQAGSVVSLDASGVETGRRPTDLQAASSIASGSGVLVLWGALSNDLGVVSRDGTIATGHSLDRRGYSGFTTLRIVDNRIVGIMNGGYADTGLYRVVPIAQDFDGRNQTRGTVDLYAVSFVVDGSDLLLSGSHDDGQTQKSVVARYSPSTDRVIEQHVDAKYGECSMNVLLGRSLVQACTITGDPGFERVLRLVDVATLREADAVTLDKPIRALAVTRDGRILAAVGNQILALRHDLKRRTVVYSHDPADKLTIDDFQSAYEIDDTWYVILKGPRLDVGDARTHVATVLTVDLRTGTFGRSLPINLERTGEMGAVTVVPTAWFNARR